MIDLKTLKQLIKLMTDNELSELDLRDKDEQVTLKRGATGIVQQLAPAPMMAAPMPMAAAPAVAAGGAAPAAAKPVDDGLIPIPSPMVGTFYAAPSPDAEAFVKVGSPVDANTVVCIVEAMKVFNEIKAEVSGTIEKMLVNTGQAVEYGQPLFMVRPH
ncbi:MAG: acetyl-CoA carboxylase biotin carboxyl carrier protein [Planctomycetes bacterium]|nr:acetyl-CoA carboxylase biotin carboxyl carrier protein [Planctomycetota bacterium]